MDLAATSTGLRSLRGTRWPDATGRFVDRLRGAGHRPGELLTVGTADHEPWHLVAHLSESAVRRDEPLLDPTWVRRTRPSAGPNHLRHGLERIEAAGRGATVLVVAPVEADVALLERIDDARRRGSTVLALTVEDPELESVSHDALTTGRVGDPAGAPFDLVQHLVSLAPRPRRLGRR